MTRALAVLLAAVAATACNLYNEYMWDGCPPADGLTFFPEGEPQCGYSTHSLAAGGEIARGCYMTGFTATGEHGCGWVKQWRCANQATVTQAVDPEDMWSTVTIETPECTARFEGPLER